MIPTLHTQEYGYHGTTLLLLHGLGGGASMWEPVAEKLATDRRVLVPDLLARFGRRDPGCVPRGRLAVQAGLLWARALHRRVRSADRQLRRAMVVLCTHRGGGDLRPRPCRRDATGEDPGL